MKKKSRKAVIRLLALLVIYSAVVCRAAESGKEESSSGWYTDLKTGKKYFYDREGQLYEGWLYWRGSWYYFNHFGVMSDGGYEYINGQQYFFYNTGEMAANTYVGDQFIDEDGHSHEEYNVRLIGEDSLSMEQKDMITDAAYYVPGKWMKRFVEDGWQVMFYTKKKYFEAPDTDMGIYYTKHKLDSTYKKLKVIDPEELVEGFGEYIGYASGLYEEGNEKMEILWRDQITVEAMAEIPDYYSSDPEFYFGTMCRLYWDAETKADLEREAPESFQVLKELLEENTAPAEEAEEAEETPGIST